MGLTWCDFQRPLLDVAASGILILAYTGKEDDPANENF